MAHQVETMAYAGELPWHGLGQKVEDNLTPQDMVTLKVHLPLKNMACLCATLIIIF